MEHRELNAKFGMWNAECGMRKQKAKKIGCGIEIDVGQASELTKKARSPAQHLAIVGQSNLPVISPQYQDK
jgi:hypothetical protein